MTATLLLRPERLVPKVSRTAPASAGSSPARTDDVKFLERMGLVAGAPPSGCDMLAYLSMSASRRDLRLSARIA